MGKSTPAAPIKLVRPEGDVEGDPFCVLEDALGFKAMTGQIASIAGIIMFSTIFFSEDAMRENAAIPVFGVIGIVWYFYEVFSSKVWKYIAHPIGENDLKKYVEKLQTAIPDVHFHIQNYHVNMQGQQILSARFSKTWNPKTYRDTTQPLDKVVQRDAKDREVKTFMCEFKMDFLADTATKAEMDAAKDAFYKEKWMDEQQSNCLEYTIRCEEYTRYMLLVLDPEYPDECPVPWYLTRAAFVLSTLLCLSYPYRMFIFGQAPKLDWKVSKYLLSGVLDQPQAEPEPTAGKAVAPEPEHEDMPAASADREGELRTRGQRSAAEVEE